jgi:nucleotide-binding universal stress UspA family protein
MKAEYTFGSARSGQAPQLSPVKSAPPVAPAPLLTRLLVASDLSPLSGKALDYAVALARRSGGASVHVINVMEPFAPSADYPEDELARECERELAGMAADRSTPQLSISSAVHMGVPAAEIVKVAAMLRPDVLVLGTHGRSGWRRLVLGSVAEQVVREAPCPVLVVRERQRRCLSDPRRGPAPWALHKILVPTDLSRLSADALGYAVGFAQQFGGKITLVHVVARGSAMEDVDDPREDSEEKIEAARRGAARALAALQRHYVPAALDDGAEVRVGSPLADLPEIAEAGDFDLIICATHGDLSRARALLGSVTEGILRTAPCPVLVARNAPTVPSGDARAA